MESRIEDCIGLPNKGREGPTNPGKGNLGVSYNPKNIMGVAYPRDILEHAPSALVNVSEIGYHLFPSEFGLDLRSPVFFILSPLRRQLYFLVPCTRESKTFSMQWIPDFKHCISDFFSMELGFRIPNLSKIPDSLSSWIPKLRILDSITQIFPDSLTLNVYDEQLLLFTRKNFETFVCNADFFIPCIYRL